MRWLLILIITIPLLLGTLTGLNAHDEDEIYNDPSADDDGANSSEAPEDTGVVELDINLEDMQRSPGVATSSWKESKIYYKFHNKTLRQYNYTAALETLWHIENRTCLRFIEQTPDSDVKKVLKFLPIIQRNGPLFRENKCVQKANRRRIVALRSIPECQTFPNYIFAIGWAIGISLESSRSDRDDYIDVKHCSKRPTISPNQYKYGHFYDYHSVAHPKCYKYCYVPKQPNIKACGQDSNPNGYTVIDADKINHFWNCQGCHSHRWLDATNTKYMANWLDFKISGDEKPAHVCRAYDLGSITIGRLVDGVCYIYSRTNSSVFQATPGTGVNKVQVLAHGASTTIVVAKEDSTETTGYQVRNGGTGNPVPLGRDHDNVPFYLAVGQFTAEGVAVPNTLLGWVQENSTTLWGIGNDKMVHEAATWNKLTCI